MFRPFVVLVSCRAVHRSNEERRLHGKSESEGSQSSFGRLDCISTKRARCSNVRRGESRQTFHFIPCQVVVISKRLIMILGIRLAAGPELAEVLPSHGNQQPPHHDSVDSVCCRTRTPRGTHYLHHIGDPFNAWSTY